MKAIILYLKGVRFELEKVTWPKKNDVVRLTMIVFIFSIGAGLYLGFLDIAFTKALEFVIAR